MSEQRRRSILWCVEHDSPNDPCDQHLLELEYGDAKPCRVVRATLILNELAKANR